MTDSLKTQPSVSEDDEADAVVIGLGGFLEPCHDPTCIGLLYFTGRSLADHLRYILPTAPINAKDEKNFLYTCNVCGAGRWTNDL